MTVVAPNDLGNYHLHSRNMNCRLMKCNLNKGVHS